jgi:hypothetical protein
MELVGKISTMKNSFKENAATSYNREYKVPFRFTQIASGRKLPMATSCTLRTL